MEWLNSWRSEALWWCFAVVTAADRLNEREQEGGEAKKRARRDDRWAFGVHPSSSSAAAASSLPWLASSRRCVGERKLRSA
jgi:hypothetical protein